MVRYLNGDWTGFQITYVRSGRWLKCAEREQAIQLVSSFTITYYPAPSSNCPPLLYCGALRPALAADQRYVLTNLVPPSVIVANRLNQNGKHLDHSYLFRRKIASD